MASPGSLLQLCAGKKRKHYECEHKKSACNDTETTDIHSNDYWTALSGEGQEHKFFVYVKVVDKHNRDNVFFKYVDSTLSIKSLKTKILMHSHKDLKTRINLNVKIDKVRSMRKRIDLQNKTKNNESLQDVMANYNSCALLLGSNRMFRVVINWSIQR